MGREEEPEVRHKGLLYRFHTGIGARIQLETGREELEKLSRKEWTLWGKKKKSGIDLQRKGLGAVKTTHESRQRRYPEGKRKKIKIGEGSHHKYEEKKLESKGVLWEM